MTIRRNVTRLFLAAWLAVISLNAHDPSKHKGKPLKGQITAIGGDGFEVLTDGQKLKVSLTSKTKIEHGNQAAGREHLQKGTHVSVFGTKLPSGEMVAREVVIETGQKATSQKGSTEKKHEHKQH